MCVRERLCFAVFPSPPLPPPPPGVLLLALRTHAMLAMRKASSGGSAVRPAKLRVLSVYLAKRPKLVERYFARFHITSIGVRYMSGER